jgi:hypothetical protein
MNPMGWLAMLSGIQAILGIGQASKQNQMAESLMESAQYYRDLGIQRMTGAIKKRQSAYDQIWKLVYGGVENADLQALLNVGDILGDRYYYDEEGLLKRKNSVSGAEGGGGEEYFERHPDEKPKTTTTPGGIVDRRSGYSNPAADKEDPLKTGATTHSRDTSITGGTKSGVSISKKTGNRYRSSRSGRGM